MKKNKTISGLICIALLLLPLVGVVGAYADSNRCTTCLVVTPMIVDSTNESICYDNANCWANVTWSNGTNMVSNQAMTMGSGCRGRYTMTLTPYGNDAADLVFVSGYCHRGALTGAWDAGYFYAGSSTLYQEVDAVEENQATAETNAINRSASDRAYLDSEILTRVSTTEYSNTSASDRAYIDSEILTRVSTTAYVNGTAETIANDDANAGLIITTLDTAVTTVNTNTNTKVLNSSTWLTAEGVANTASIIADSSNHSATEIANVDSKYALTATDIGNRTTDVERYLGEVNTAIQANDDANLVTILADSSNHSAVSLATSINATNFLYNYMYATNSSIWNKIDIADEAVWGNSTLFCRLWGLISWPTAQQACYTRMVTGTN